MQNAIFTLLLKYWFVPDTSLSTFERLNVMTLLPMEDKEKEGQTKSEVLDILRARRGSVYINKKRFVVCGGIPNEIREQKSPVFIYSGGYSNECKPYAYCAYTMLKANIISGPCVVLEYPSDTRRAFNFCQEQDLHCLRLVYRQVRFASPQARIILFGACKGAANNLRFLATHDQQDLTHIKAVVAESPVISVQKALSHWQNGGRLSHWLCLFTFPNYKPNLTSIMQAVQFPSSIPILIASLPEDTLSQISDIKSMVDHLQQFSDQIFHFTSSYNMIKHGQIGRAHDYKEVVQDFLSQRDLR